MNQTVSGDPTEANILPISWANRSLRISWELALYTLILLLAIFTRFYILDARVMSHDESLHTYFSYVFYQEGNFEHTPLMHGPLLFEVNALIYAIFGANDFTARIYPATLGILLVLSPILFRRWLGRETALIACLLLLISPITLYYNRYIRHDTPVLFFAVVLLWSILMYLEESGSQKFRNRYLYLLAISLLLCFASKENTFIYLGIFSSYFFLFWIFRVIEKYVGISVRRAFSLLLLAIVLGIFVSILMSGILAISLNEYDSFSGRINAISNGFSRLFSPETIPLNQEGSVNQFLIDQNDSEHLGFNSFLLWSSILFLGASSLIIGPAIFVFRRSTLPWKEIITILIIAIFVMIALVSLESRSLEAIPGIAPSPKALTNSYQVNSLPFFSVWILTLIIIVSSYLLAKSGFWRAMRAFPEFDVLVVLVTLTVPWLSATLITAMGPGFPYGEEINTQILPDIARAVIESIRSVIPINLPGYDESTLNFNHNTQIWQIILSLFPVLPFFISSAAVGIAWNRKRWITLAIIYFGLYAVIFTSIFSNINGLGSGLVSSLGYWLGQQGVRRGSQPQYYYTGIILPLYEYLPIIGSFLATIAGIYQFWRNKTLAYSEGIMNSLKIFNWPSFFAWWGVLAIFGYTLAGEKMPWLGIHMAFPLIMLSACFFGPVLKTIDWCQVINIGWLPYVLMPGVTWGIWRIINFMLRGLGPFRGLTTVDQRYTTLWFGAVLLTVFFLWLIYREGKRKEWRIIHQTSFLGIFTIFCVLTARTAFAASFINYDYAKEFLVYAHSAPQVKYVINLLSEISERSVNGKDLRFGYAGDGVSWPLEWYLRDFPNSIYYGVEPDLNTLQQEDVLILGPNLHQSYSDLLSVDYSIQKYLRLWWPNQDYFHLTPARINKLFDFAPNNHYSYNLRSGLLDIFWSRDFTHYNNTMGVSPDISNWNPASHMYLYLHRDLATQIWSFDLDPVGVIRSKQIDPENICPLFTDTSEGTLLLADSSIGYPAGIVAKNEQILIADEQNHQIRLYSYTGELLEMHGDHGDIYDPDDPNFQSGQSGDEIILNRPNGVIFTEDDTLFVADTWNYRIQKLNISGDVELIWGEQLAYGANAPIEPVSGFWGPRDLLIDSLGYVYVADTGNKRIRVYTESGTHIFDIGEGGSLLGQLEEPGSIAIDHNSGELFVSEWWNQRVSVFSLSGNFLRSFPYPVTRQREGVAAQIAIDPQRQLLYLSIPHQNRLVLLDYFGNCLSSLGPYSNDHVNNFQNVTDITVDETGNLLVADNVAKKIILYPPYQQNQIELPSDSE